MTNATEPLDLREALRTLTQKIDVDLERLACAQEILNAAKLARPIDVLGQFGQSTRSRVAPDGTGRPGARRDGFGDLAWIALALVVIAISSGDGAHRLAALLVMGVPLLAWLVLRLITRLSAFPLELRIHRDELHAMSVHRRLALEAEMARLEAMRADKRAESMSRRGPGWKLEEVDFDLEPSRASADRPGATHPRRIPRESAPENQDDS